MRWSFEAFIEDPVTHSFFRPETGRPPSDADATRLVDRMLQDLRSKHKGFDVDGSFALTKAGGRIAYAARVVGTVEAEDMVAAATLVSQRLTPAIATAGADYREANYYFWPAP